MLCIEFLRAFSGSNVSRLLVGGMLADLSVEHCIWVRGEDLHNPETAAGEDRDNLFLLRLNLLFDEGHVLTSPNTYTAEVVAFLRRCKSVRYGPGPEDFATFGGQELFKGAAALAMAQTAFEQG